MHLVLDLTDSAVAVRKNIHHSHLHTLQDASQGPSMGPTCKKARQSETQPATGLEDTKTSKPEISWSTSVVDIFTIPAISAVFGANKINFGESRLQQKLLTEF